MLTLLQISVDTDSGSIGKIAKQIGDKVINLGGMSYFTYAAREAKARTSASKLMKIGSYFTFYVHVLINMLLDAQGGMFNYEEIDNSWTPQFQLKGINYAINS